MVKQEGDIMSKLEDEAQNIKPLEPVSIDEKAMLIAQIFGEFYHDFGGDTNAGFRYGYRYYQKPLFIQTGIEDDRQRITIVFYEKVPVRIGPFKTHYHRERMVYDQ